MKKKDETRSSEALVSTEKFNEDLISNREAFFKNFSNVHSLSKNTINLFKNSSN